jgi:hypothetical protein
MHQNTMSMIIKDLGLEFMPIHINSQFYTVYNALSLCIAVNDLNRDNCNPISFLNKLIHCIERYRLCTALIRQGVHMMVPYGACNCIVMSCTTMLIASEMLS